MSELWAALGFVVLCIFIYSIVRPEQFKIYKQKIVEKVRNWLPK